MSDMLNNDVLDYLREQFALLNAKLDRFEADLSNLRGRDTAPGADSGHRRIAFAALNARLDRMEYRLGRIEARERQIYAASEIPDCIIDAMKKAEYLKPAR